MSKIPIRNQDRLTSFLNLIGGIVVQQIEIELAEINLKQSRIIKNISFQINNNKLQFIIPDYYVYIESGRKPFARPVPIKPLVDWIRRNNIRPFKGTVNDLAWAIRKSIYKKGIRARPFLQEAFSNSEIDKILEIEFSDFLDDEIKKIIIN